MVIVFDDGKWVATLMLNKRAEHKHNISEMATTFKAMTMLPINDLPSVLRAVVETFENLNDRSSVVFESTLDKHCAFMYNIEYAQLTMLEVTEL
jgi:hypothetical protein